MVGGGYLRGLTFLFIIVLAVFLVLAVMFRRKSRSIRRILKRDQQRLKRHHGGKDHDSDHSYNHHTVNQTSDYFNDSAALTQHANHAHHSTVGNASAILRG
jgi:hypothetical protein